jgi:O-antigen ligase
MAVLPGVFESRIDAMTFRLPEGGLYSTLGHYNYVGSYAALVLPLFAALALGSEPTKLRSVSRIAAVLLGVVWIACGSRAGLVGGALAAIALAVALRQLWVKHASRIALGALLAVALVTVARPAVVRSVAERAGAGIANLLAPVGAAERSRLESLPVRAASMAGRRLRLETRRGELIVVNEGGGLSVADATGRALEVLVEAGTGRVTITDERFSRFEFLNGRLNGHQALVVRQGAFVMRFVLTAGGFQYVSEAGRPLPLDPVAAWGGRGHEDAASARVYIWSRAVPVLRDTILLGYGPDTFAAAFPQHDFVGKYLAYGTSEMLVDKPHNFYLQTALNTGVLSMFALGVLFVAYTVQSCRVYWMRLRRDEPWLIGLGSFAGVAGYLAAAAFNDSVVSVAPVFWVMLGMGMSTLARSTSSDPGLRV